MYELLGLAYIEPELRENRGELEAARLDGGAGLPSARSSLGGHPRRPAQPHGRLRRPRHDRGDGRRRARARLRVSGDHRPLGDRMASATTSRPSSCAARSSWCTRWTRRIEGIELLAGSEVNILPDGSLDYEDELLAELDWVIASVHTAFGTSRTGDDRADDHGDRAPARGRDRPSHGPPDRAARALRDRPGGGVRRGGTNGNDARDQRQPRPARPVGHPRPRGRARRRAHRDQLRRPPHRHAREHALGRGHRAARAGCGPRTSPTRARGRRCRSYASSRGQQLLGDEPSTTWRENGRERRRARAA